MWWKGFRFGMLLQIAIGPVSIYILNMAIAAGFKEAMAGSLGVALGDTIYIILAVIGIGTVIEKKPKLKRSFGYIGALVLIIFGMRTFIHALMMQALTIPAGASYTSFLGAFGLTVSSPLTIVFWGGVFSAKISEDGMGSFALFSFAFGAISSTLFAMSLIAFLGATFNQAMPFEIVKGINLLVGVVLVAFGVRSFIKQRGMGNMATEEL